MKSIIKIPDSTLSDSRYYNNWNFSEKLYEKYFQLLAKQEDINCIEIGFRSLGSNNYNDPLALNKYSFINRKKLPRFNYAVMFNASTLIKLNKTSNKKNYVKIVSFNNYTII